MIRYNSNIDVGLTQNQVKSRIDHGLVNYDTNIKTKSIKDIILSNIFTIFNLLNFALAFFIVFVKSYKNLLFLGVVFCNTLISIIQEINSKRIIDKLSIVSSTKVKVVRDGVDKLIKVEQLVLDDIVKLKIGNQIVADLVVLEGNVEVNESLLTGEENHIIKNKGDMLYSGSFIVSGNCIARVEKVGANSYANKISKEAKYIKKINSEIMKTLNKILKIISIVIIPVSILLFLNQYNLNHNLEVSIVNTVAAVIGMIPEGLVLLTSTALAVSVIRLGKNSVLVQQLYCIETLARVDTICLDKTGTLTEGCMEVVDVIVLNKKYNHEKILSALSLVFKDDNETMAAISRKFTKNPNWTLLKKEDFSSLKKYSKAKFLEGTFTLGAPDVISDSLKVKKLVEENSDYRTVLLKSEYADIALILLKDKLRYKAKSALKYFDEEGVSVKIISGDNINVVSRIAKQLGIENIKAIDMSEKINNRSTDFVEQYNIFCRVSPSDKKKIIKALKKNGHTVAMTGDGVNDVLALKEADCSIAMATGSDAAKSVSEIVLLESNFDAIPKIVLEGRRTINNIERSSSLFLTKTIYSTLLSLIFMFISESYPFQPIQLSLMSTLTIGVPGFLLALSINKERIKGNFFINIIRKSIPGGITIVINILAVILYSELFRINSEEISTIAVILTAITGFILLFKVCNPFTKFRIFMYISLILIFIGCVIGFPNLFELVKLKPILIVFIILIFMLDIMLFNFLSELCEKKIFKYKDKLVK